MTTIRTEQRNRDFERLYVGDRQIDMAHFYSIGMTAYEEEAFSYGYWTHDGVFVSGITYYNGEDFNQHVATRTTYFRPANESPDSADASDQYLATK